MMIWLQKGFYRSYPCVLFLIPLQLHEAQSQAINDDDDVFWFIYDSFRVWAWMKCGLPSESWSGEAPGEQIGQHHCHHPDDGDDHCDAGGDGDQYGWSENNYGLIKGQWPYLLQGKSSYKGTGGHQEWVNMTTWLSHWSSYNTILGAAVRIN